MSTWLIDTALYTGLLIALVLVLRRPVARTFGPGMAYALWALPLLRLVLPPLVLPASLAPQAAEPVVLDPSVMAMVLAAEEMNAAAPMPAAVAPAMWSLSELLLPVWLGGAGLLLAWRVWSYLRMRRAMLAEARPVGEAGKVRLVETPAVASPIAFGVLDKVVALPPRFMAMEDRRARDLAIAHELAHHRGHDIAANFAAQPLLALHWFNPLAWLGWHAMRRDQEAACDARVMAGRDRAERAAYAGVLAGFAAGPRLALAAPMACPVLGGKSIIHRLRSLAMSDISPRRRTAGRLLLGAAAVALPLTASISYAQSEAPAVEEVELAPSAAPADAPEVRRDVRVVRIDRDGDADSEAPDGEKDVLVYRLHRDGDAPPAEDERRMIFREQRELSEEQRKRFEEMAHEWEKKGAEWTARSGEFEALAREHEGRALALVERMPRVIERCDEGSDGVTQTVDDKGKHTIVICERAIERHALRSAVFGLRQARASIAGNRELDAEVRNDILEDLDKEIERIERENRES
jgi:beta-lactamase regulating signal transducer with metallopeptidase domain